MRKTLLFAYGKLTGMLRGTGIGRFYALRKLDALLVSHLKPREIEVNGYRMILDKNDSLRLSVAHTLNRCELELLKREIKEGDVVVDIGANIGYYTLLASKNVGVHGRVYAFEPDPTNFSLLQKNVALNNCENVTLVNKAVAARSETLKLYLSEVNLGDHRAYASEEARESISIECTSIDDYFKDKAENIDFIKIDIQGFECKALRGMQATLKKSKGTRLTAEFWPYGLTRAGDSPEELFQLLQSADFELYEIDNQKNSIEPADTGRLLSTYRPDTKDYTNLFCIKR